MPNYEYILYNSAEGIHCYKLDQHGANKLGQFRPLFSFKTNNSGFLTVINSVHLNEYHTIGLIFIFLLLTIGFRG